MMQFNKFVVNHLMDFWFRNNMGKIFDGRNNIDKTISIIIHILNIIV